MSDRIYPVRYLVEQWNKPMEESDKGGEVILEGKVRKSKSNYGYTDALFVASILKDEQGNYSSILLMDSDSGGLPSKKMLLEMKAMIEHHLKEHIDGRKRKSD